MMASTNDLHAHLTWRILEYKHPGVVRRISKECGMSLEQAEMLFDDTKKWLLIAATSDRVLAPSVKIDDAWHCFILFTKDYQDFCQTHFGFFLHHKPSDGDDEVDLTGAAKHAVTIAENVFGSVSENWYGKVGNCSTSDCSPVPSCSGDTPADCALIKGILRLPAATMSAHIPT